MPYFDRVISDNGYRLRTSSYLSFTDTAIHTYLMGTRMILFAQVRLQVTLQVAFNGRSGSYSGLKPNAVLTSRGSGM